MYIIIFIGLVIHLGVVSAIFFKVFCPIHNKAETCLKDVQLNMVETCFSRKSYLLTIVSSNLFENYRVCLSSFKSCA